MSHKAVLQCSFRSPNTRVLQAVGPSGVFSVSRPIPGFGTRGEKLAPPVQQKMEQFFGADFSDVRVHVGPQAASIGALAFTHGSDIYFAPGQYQPTAPRGEQLLGHELTHVVQQRAGRVRNPLRHGLAVVQDKALEDEADRRARRLVTFRTPVQAKVDPTASPRALSLTTARRGNGLEVRAADRGAAVGSVRVHDRNGAAEVTDLGVESGHRGQGVGGLLLSSAAQAGRALGCRTLRLSSDDRGSGRLTRWYRGLGFRQVGTDAQGRPRLEVPVTRLLHGGAQPRPSACIPAIQRMEGSRSQDDRRGITTAPRAILTPDRENGETRTHKHRSSRERVLSKPAVRGRAGNSLQPSKNTPQGGYEKLDPKTKHYRNFNGTRTSNPGTSGYVCANDSNGVAVCKKYSRRFFETMNTLSYPGQTSYHDPVLNRTKTTTSAVNKKKFAQFDGDDKKIN